MQNEPGSKAEHMDTIIDCPPDAFRPQFIVFTVPPFESWAENIEQNCLYVGLAVGISVGIEVGSIEGIGEGKDDGCWVGLVDGKAVGRDEGGAEGFGVGKLVGTYVTSPLADPAMAKSPEQRLDPMHPSRITYV